MLDFKKDGKITGQTILFQFDDFRGAIAPVFILELELLESNDSFTKFWWDI